MDVLADTNILVRRIDRSDLQHKTARVALSTIVGRGDRVCIVPQNVVEFWNVATRPVSRNGLGLNPGYALRVVSRIEDAFYLLPERAEIYDRWKALVALHSVSGSKVHDARLVASAIVYGIESVLTFNVADFLRFPEVKVMHPREFAS